ncbi:hypothetical protein, partial [uncultured Senegalimassilia sp.]|uniref:hypothetical protein n=1 Tax=uncultured Senegalimassilia sp. TaxID=1714350 RepID=UPI00258EBE58
RGRAFPLHLRIRSSYTIAAGGGSFRAHLQHNAMTVVGGLGEWRRPQTSNARKMFVRPVWFPPKSPRRA